MLVSVVIPNYNHAPYLKKRIDSVFSQTYQNIEVIILDDCSTDNSKDIIEEYRDSKKVSQIIYNTNNTGNTFLQWTKGIEVSKGEIIWIAESDDYCEPSFLENLLPPFYNDPDLILSFCQSIFINTENDILNKSNATNLSKVWNGRDFIIKNMLGANGIPNASMAIFKREKVNTSKEVLKMKYCGDWLFWVLLCEQGNVFVSGKYLNYYLRHEQNVGTSAVIEGCDFLEGNKIFLYLKSNINISQENKTVALKLRVAEFLQNKKYYKSAKVKSEVYKSMISLDPSIRLLIIKKRIFNKFFNSLKMMTGLLRSK